MRARQTRLLMGFAALVATAACSSIPPGRTVVDSIAFEGTTAIDDDEILSNIATAPSPKFLNLWSGVIFDYSFYDRFTLRRDLARVERFYRARGYYEAHVRVARVVPRKAGHVAITVEVEEGPATTLRAVELRGLEGLPPEVRVAADAAANSHLRRNRRFDEDDFASAEAAIRRALTDRGYAYATVSRAAEVDLPKHAAEVRFDITPHERVRLGMVTLVGLGSLPEQPVRRALNLTEGQPYSTQAFEDAQQAVFDLGIFTSVEVEPELRDPPSPDGIVPVVVRVEISSLHTVQLGVGFEFDAIKTDLHGIGQWEAKNFLGGLRNLTVRDKPGVVLYPTSLGVLEGPERILPENRLRTELRQPGFLEARTKGKVRFDYNVYPLLLGTRKAEETTVIGYQEVAGSIGVERPLWRVFVNPSYNIQSNFPFAYKGNLSLESVIVSYVDLLTSLDLRDDSVHPRKGVLVSVDTQLAGGLLGGDARDWRIQPDLRVYVPVTRRVTIAARGTFGFLFPAGYGSTYTQYAEHGAPSAEASASWTRDLQILFFRGFYSGGVTNRGYPLRGVGPHGPVQFLNPEVAVQQFATKCNAGSADYDETRCLYPLGGLSLWEASLEVRFPITGPLSATAFGDSSDVSPRTLSLRFDRPHPSVGLGVRYDTPVGPIRLDVGYRLAKDDPAEAPPLLFGVFRGAVAFGIGEAF